MAELCPLPPASRARRDKVAVAALPIPEINARVGGLMVDALWRERRVIVELDRHAAHATRARLEADRRRDLWLRALGYVVLRYTWRQVVDQPDLVVADLTDALARAPAALPARG